MKRCSRWWATIAGAVLVGCAGSPSAVESAVPSPTLKWARGGCFSSWCQTGWYSSPSVADIDGDGNQEVIWGSYDLVSLDGETGTEEWRAAHGSRVWPGTVVTDLTGDGSLEIVVGRDAYNLMVYNSSGTLLWNRRPFGTGEVRTLAVDDLDGDGIKEIVVGGFVNALQVSVYDPSGNVRSGWPARHSGEPGYGAGLFNENVALGDMDGDGDMEVFATTDSHYIQGFDHNGNQLTVHPRYTDRTYWSQVGVHVDDAVDLRGYANCGVEHRPNFIDAAPAIADVNGDGTPELIAVGNVHNCGINPYASLYHVPLVFNLDRSRWSGDGFDWTVLPTPAPGAGPKSEDWSIIQTAVNSVVVADLDSDGFLEILYPSYDGRLHAFWLDKTQHGSWPYTVPSTGSGGDTFRFASEPAVADLDGDGQAEVVFTSWPKTAIHDPGHLHILDSLGHELHRVPLPGPAGEWGGGLAAPTLANVDADNDLEIIVGTASYGVVVFDLPGVRASDVRFLWSTGRANSLRNGRPEAAALPTSTLAISDPAPAAEGVAGTSALSFTVTLDEP